MRINPNGFTQALRGQKLSTIIFIIGDEAYVRLREKKKSVKLGSDPSIVGLAMAVKWNHSLSMQNQPNKTLYLFTWKVSKEVFETNKDLVDANFRVIFQRELHTSGAMLSNKKAAL